MDRKTSILMSLGISIALIAAGIWILCYHQNSLADGSQDLSSQLMLIGGDMGIVVILFWLAVLSAIGLVFSAVVSNRRTSGRWRSQNSSDAVNRLKQGNTCGKINKHGIKAMKRDLS